MPPAVESGSPSASDISEGGDIPFKIEVDESQETVAEAKQTNGDLKDKVEEAIKKQGDGSGKGKASDGEEDDDAQNEDEYEVESIQSHKFLRGKLALEVKWKGYPDDQNTFEAEPTLQEGSPVILEAYYSSIGGRPEHPSKLGKRKSAAQLRASTDAPSAKKPKTTKQVKEESQTDDESTEDDDKWVSEKWASEKSWEDLILRVDTIERDPPTGKLWAFIVFTGKPGLPGKRQKVAMDLMKQKAPIKMLNFYEQHLAFHNRED